MTQRPLVSVVMTVLNPHPAYFPAAVESVLSQTLDALELVIVEDPSDRSAAEMLAAFDDPRIRHVCNPARTSHVRQRNASLELASADLVAVMDADDICAGHRIERQVEYLQQHPEVTVVGSNLAIIDTEGETQGYRNYPQDHDQIASALRRFNPLAQPATMFRREAVLEAGGYQYDRYPAVEDYELWCRLAKGGARFANLSEPLLRYRIHPEGLKSAKLRGIIKGTLEVKQMYFQERMNWGDRMRWQMERGLLLLPSGWVLRLFQATQYRRRLAE